jgi:hypothetical protein
MISCFPDPYPDELLYSLCARYAERVRFPSEKAVIQELFGEGAAVAIVDLPSNLGRLVSSLPNNQSYSVENLVNKHTLFPFFAPFLDPRQAQQVMADMESPKGPTIHTRSGIMASKVQSPIWLKFCPLCAKSDKRDFGESYWHRLHQIPGVEVCFEHNVRLVNSSVRIQNPKLRYRFIPAEEGIRLPKSDFFKLKTAHHEILLKIAQDTAWLLNNPTSPPGLEILLKRYHQLLAELDLATYNGRVRVTNLLKRFCQAYPTDLLNALQCQVDQESEHNWLFRLVRSPKGSQYPLRHLLLIHFLGHTAETFLQLPNQFLPFGHGPWPCLNKAAPHFSESVIQDYELTYSKEHGKPIGIFHCSCGFVYSRTGPDENEEDRFNITKIKNFGSIWDESLKKLWGNSTISLRQIAKNLGVDANTVKLHADRLELPFPRKSERSTHRSKRKLATPLNHKNMVSESIREHCRSTWLSARRQFPELGRTALRKRYVKIYTWLRRHDGQWLEANMPPKMQKALPPPRVNWETRDAHLVKELTKCAERLYSRRGRPKRVTLTAIAKESGKLALIQRHLNKLPNTADLLERLVETREDYTRRKILWVTERYQQEMVCPPRWKFIRAAGIREDLVLNPAIQNLIQQQLEFLDEVVRSSSEVRNIERISS